MTSDPRDAVPADDLPDGDRPAADPAYPPAHVAQAVGPARRLRPVRQRSLFGRLARLWFGACLVLGAVSVACLAAGLHGADFTPLHVIVGDDSGGVSINGTDGATGVLLALGAILGTVTAVMLVPLFIGLVIGIVALALVAGFGLPLVALALALAVAASPLWIVALLAWALLRRRAPAPAPLRRSATIAA